MEKYKTRQTQKTQKIGILIKIEDLGVTSINKPFCGNHFECKPSPEKMKMVPVAQLLKVEVCILALCSVGSSCLFLSMQLENSVPQFCDYKKSQNGQGVCKCYPQSKTSITNPSPPLPHNIEFSCLVLLMRIGKNLSVITRMVNERQCSRKSHQSDHSLIFE